MQVFLQLQQAGATLCCSAQAPHCGFSFEAQALGARASVFAALRLYVVAQVQWLWRTGLVALQPVESSQTKDGACVPALAGRFLSTAPPGKSSVGVFKV